MLIHHHETPDDNDWSKTNQHMKPKNLKDNMWLLRDSFRKDKNVCWMTEEAEPNIDYVHWLEDRLFAQGEEKEKEIGAPCEYCSHYKQPSEPAPSPQKALPEVGDKSIEDILKEHLGKDSAIPSKVFDDNYRNLLNHRKSLVRELHQHTLQVIEKVLEMDEWMKKMWADHSMGSFMNKCAANEVLDEIRNRLNNIK